MGRRTRRVVLAIATAVATALGMLLVSVTPASAAASTTVGSWSLDEAPGARTAVDGSGYGHHGAVGSDISTGARSYGATGYRFPTWASNAPGHLVTVRDSSRLDPGTSDYAVSVRLRTARFYSNVVQKGQSGTAGGFWKLEVARGVVTCQFRTSTGSNLTVGSKGRLDDGKWHAVRCGRSGRTVSLYVDGVRQSVRTGLSGSISNSWELAIGGKSRCAGENVGCDFYAGDIDSVRIQKG
jgi:Concanavalin A-like lectin/glucanases superfamily